MWVIFLLYCWKSGLVDQKKVNELVSEVDQVLVKAETNLRKELGVEVGKPRKEPAQSVDNAPIISQEDGQMHVVFSTDCSPYQDWQTLLLFHSATVVGQKGRITRIASGCDEAKQKKLNALYRRLYPMYDAHYTPDFKKDAKTNKKCKFQVDLH